jgi:hypothetical protein
VVDLRRTSECGGRCVVFYRSEVLRCPTLMPG